MDITFGDKTKNYGTANSLIEKASAENPKNIAKPTTLYDFIKKYCVSSIFEGSLSSIKYQILQDTYIRKIPAEAKLICI